MQVKNILGSLWILILVPSGITGQCTKPTTSDHAVVDNPCDICMETFEAGSTVKLRCHPGYEPNAIIPHWYTCGIDGEWTPDPEKFTCHNECRSPLGMESRIIPDENLAASSVFYNLVSLGSGWQPYLARLNNNDGRIHAWAAATNDQSQWLQVDLGSKKRITGIITQGAKDYGYIQYVSAFKVKYSNDSSSWQMLKDSNTSTDKIFVGNVDNDTPKKNVFDPPFYARFVRFLPWEWEERITVRMELLGCGAVNCDRPDVLNAIRVEGGSGPYGYGSILRYECNVGYRMTSDTDRMVCLEHGWFSIPKCEDECMTPLGMESRIIPDKNLAASSVFYNRVFPGSGWQPYLARLNNNEGRVNAWAAATNDQSQWLQVDLGSEKRITGIITQGAKDYGYIQYVSAFKVKYSNDSFSWQMLQDFNTSTDKIFVGNMDNDTPKKNMFDPPFYARFVRFLPWKWEERITVRMELLGCRDN